MSKTLILLYRMIEYHYSCLEYEFRWIQCWYHHLFFVCALWSMGLRGLVWTATEVVKRSTEDSGALLLTVFKTTGCEQFWSISSCPFPTLGAGEEKAWSCLSSFQPQQWHGNHVPDAHLEMYLHWMHTGSQFRAQSKALRWADASCYCWSNGRSTGTRALTGTLMPAALLLGRC